MSNWAWNCSEVGCHFAEDQPDTEEALAALLIRCVEHEDTHPGHMALAHRVTLGV